MLLSLSDQPTAESYLSQFSIRHILVSLFSPISDLIWSSLLYHRPPSCLFSWRGKVKMKIWGGVHSDSNSVQQDCPSIGDGRLAGTRKCPLLTEPDLLPRINFSGHWLSLRATRIQHAPSQLMSFNYILLFTSIFHSWYFPFTFSNNIYIYIYFASIQGIKFPAFKSNLIWSQ
jgi:hypothetical protein